MDYTTGFCGSDCIIRKETQSRFGGKNKVSDGAICKTPTFQNGFRQDLNNGHSFGRNGHTLGTRFSGKSVEKCFMKNGHRKLIVPSPDEERSSATCDSFYKDQNGKWVSRRNKSKVPVVESFEQCSLLDALYTYLCYSFLVIVGYINDLLRPRESTEKFRSVRRVSEFLSYSNLSSPSSSAFVFLKF